MGCRFVGSSRTDAGTVFSSFACFGTSGMAITRPSASNEIVGTESSIKMILWGEPLSKTYQECTNANTISEKKTDEDADRPRSQERRWRFYKQTAGRQCAYSREASVGSRCYFPSRLLERAISGPLMVPKRRTQTRGKSTPSTVEAQQQMARKRTKQNETSSGAIAMRYSRAKTNRWC